jgi:hypothetical protein
MLRASRAGGGHPNRHCCTVHRAGDPDVVFFFADVDFCWSHVSANIQTILLWVITERVRAEREHKVVATNFAREKKLPTAATVLRADYRVFGWTTQLKRVLVTTATAKRCRVHAHESCMEVAGGAPVGECVRVASEALDHKRVRCGKLAFKLAPRSPRLQMVTVEQPQQYGNNSQQSDHQKGD